MIGTTEHPHGPASQTPDSTSECAHLLAGWRAAVADSIASFFEIDIPSPGMLEKDAAAYEASSERMNDIAARAWRTPLSDPLALRLRAEIAQHEVWPRLDGGCELNRYEAMLSGLEADDDVEVGALGERAIAELVRAVLWAGSGTARPEPATRQVELACPDRSETVAQGPAPRHDWLETLRDAGPNGGAATTGTHEDDGRPVAWDDVADLVDRAKAGLTTLRTLWNSNATGTSMEFVTDSIEALLDAIADTAGEGKPAPPA
jgi:hypothetical protein